MGKQKLILAGIVSAGVLGTAVVTNLPSIFAEASEETTQAAETTQSDAGAQQANPTAEEKLAQKLDELKKHDMPVELEPAFFEDISGTFGRPHIAKAMVDQGYVKDIGEAFHRFIGEGKKCFVRGEVFSVEQTINVIRQANALAVLAHSHLMKNTAALCETLKMNFDGLDGWYAIFPKEKQMRWVDKGRHKGWLITGGSDFHAARF